MMILSMTSDPNLISRGFAVRWSILLFSQATEQDWENERDVETSPEETCQIFVSAVENYSRLTSSTGDRGRAAIFGFWQACLTQVVGGFRSRILSPQRRLAVQENGSRS